MPELQTDGCDGKINPVRDPASTVNLVVTESKDVTQNKLNTPFLFCGGKNQMVQFVQVWQKKTLPLYLRLLSFIFAFVYLCEVLSPAEPLCVNKRRPDNWLTASSAVASQASLIPYSGRSDWMKWKMNAVFRQNAQGHLGWRSPHFARW